MCFAKAITSGYFPMGAVMLNARIEAAFRNNTDAMGIISHGYTYSGHPVGCAAALACLAETTRLNLPANAATEGEYLIGRCRALAEKHETIGNVRGKGLMFAMELVCDRGAKTPVGKAYLAELADRLYDAGALVRLIGPLMVFSPPLILTRAESDEIMAAVTAAFEGMRGDPRQ
jgi:adenosylmethionine-8-amino-7-oxononanoate aminotransferase